jgi:outer membrane receptor for monomeric catechols
MTPVPKWAVSLGATYLHSHYQGPDVLLATVRKDNYSALDATVSYAYTRNLSVRLEMLGSKNGSNLELYAYRRDIAALKVRYDFK